MGIMQDNLKEMMQKFYSILEHADEITKSVIANSSYNNEIQNVYKKLGGVLDSYPVNPREFDLITSKVIIELDEHLHFNRYRSITLESSIYDSMTKFPIGLYKDYCELFEGRCLSAGGYGGKWTNPSCERQFGMADRPNALSDKGAPRWKQRAFYDYIKDVGCFIQQQPFVRISIYDKVEIGMDKIPLFDVLNRNLSQYAEGVYQLIESRYEH